MSEAAPERSLVLLTKNAGPRFAQVLDALFACRGIESTELLCIDSGSTDGTLELLANRPRIRLHQIPPGEFGHGRTRNLAVRLTRGQLVIFLVQDATPAGPELLEQLTSHFDDPLVAGVFGRQLPHPNCNPVERFFLEDTYSATFRRRAHDGKRGLRFRDHFFSNVCAAVRREALLSVPFDETLIMCEDALWSKTTLERGGQTIYDPAARVHHSHQYALSELFRRFFDLGVSLLGIGSSDSFGELVRFEAQHISGGMYSLAQQRKLHWIPWFFIHEITKTLAFALGKRARWLPNPLRRKFSMHRYHWDRR